MISKEKKAEIIATYGRKEGDTGSPEVQIALLTERINELNAHLKENQKDLFLNDDLSDSLLSERLTH